jgi:ribokinase
MKVLTVGGAMIDTIAIIESRRIERMAMTNVDRSFLLLEEGRKTEALEISTHTGGGAVNTAVALARLGGDVAALVKLGRDQRAETILARLMEEGISTRWVLRDAREPTGASVLVSSHERNAAVFTFRGANGLLEPQDLKPDAFAVDLVYVAGLSNRSAERFGDIVRGAKARGAKVTANPGIRQLSARGGEILDLAADIDVLAINRIEAEALVPQLVARFGDDRALPPEDGGGPLPRLVERGLHGGGHDLGLVGFVRALARLGCPAVLISDGGNGVYLGTPDTLRHCPAHKVAVAGTAGAGDALAATFSGFWTMGEPADVALRAATLNAASVVTYVDTQTGLLTRDVLDRRVAETASALPIRTWNLG